MTPSGKETIKRILGEIPYTAELYWLIRQRGKPLHNRFRLRNLQCALPEVVESAVNLRKSAQDGRKILVFASLHMWIEHAALVATALSAQGHKVTFGYLPYGDWYTDTPRFDLRRQNAYARKVLEPAEEVMDIVSFLSIRAPYTPLPDELVKAVREVSIYDTQYTQQVEEIDTECELFKLRTKRNREMAQAALAWLRSNRPDVVVLPNGTIQEFGVLYRVARHMKIPVVTYEFNEQRQCLWLAQNAEVMRQDTSALWEARRDLPLAEEQIKRIQGLFSARKHAALWENFARLWQGVPAGGGEQARARLGLDNRPVVLLATNVLGDSLTLGRQVFSKNMAEWISRTVQYFMGRSDIQLVIRIHPGEVLTHGQSMTAVVKEALPRLPDNIRLIGPREEINTYDLIEVADLGLVYTTTVGMEMAMNGVPVVVSGKTHYRSRGFTYDPESWVAYFKLLGQILENPAEFRLNKEQVQSAWGYAYRFFFEYPHPFPWHLKRVWDDYKDHPLEKVMVGDEKGLFEKTFGYLAGDKVDWGVAQKDENNQVETIALEIE